MQELVDGQSNILDNSTQQYGRDVSSPVKWHGGAASVRMSVLSVGALLADFNEAKGGQLGGDLVRLEDWDIAHD